MPRQTGEDVVPSTLVASFSVADFLLPEGYAAPRASAVLREASVVTEAGRLAWSRLGARVAHHRPYAGHGAVRDLDPVVLVPGFLAGDASLALMARALREQGHRTYRSHIRANVGCTVQAADASSSRGSRRSSPDGAAASGSSATASAGCSPAVSPYAVPTWSPASSPWAARCWRREPTTPR